MISENPKGSFIESTSQDVDSFITQQLKDKEKKKRKPPQVYFKQENEDAIIEYLKEEDDIKRNKLYNTKIKNSFFKLTQNIIHTYKFYRMEEDSIEDTQQEVIAFLLKKLPKYKPSAGKAYSYFGTIAKRYLILKNKANYKKQKEQCDLEEVDKDETILNELTFPNEVNLSEFMDIYVKYVEENLTSIFIKYKKKDKLNNIVDAILTIFKSRESLESFNKKAIYFYIKQMVDVETLELTNIISILKKEYIKLFNQYYEKGYIKWT